MNRPGSSIHALLPPRSVVLGPMAGITEAPFRAICKRLGAALTYTEMVSAAGLHFNPASRVSAALLTVAPEEAPCAVQLFGSDPEVMAAQAQRVVERLSSSVALIDINMGCPVSKITGKGEGAALMRTPDLAARIVSRVAERCGVPVSVKCRAGWASDSVNAVEFARLMTRAGASLITVHGRTRDQFYRGAADWTVISRVRDAVDIPVIGSGDVLSAGDIARMFELAGVHAVMVARGAQGDPWIFERARFLLDTGTEPPPPSAFMRIDMAREHGAALVAFGGERAFVRMRKHAGWYMTGLPGATRVRERVNAATSHAELDSILAEYRQHLSDKGLTE
ncbi:MAG: tRNA dihydrouridine synthase DusB [Clostridiales bacterium]|nr:tRNA dihydrouridine synthase DusB [Clostridiales bacterium]